MTDQPADHDAAPQLDALAHEIYPAPAARFPVCLSSDEFHFFPQFKSSQDDTRDWEDFSDEGLQVRC